MMRHLYKYRETVTLSVCALGIVAMCQPFSIKLYHAGFFIIFACVAVYTVVSHLPDRGDDSQS